MCTDDIIDAVCDVTGIGRDTLTGNSRKLNVVRAREMAAYHLMTRLGLTSTMTGRVINRDHASVLHSRDMYLLDKRMDGAFRSLDGQLQARLDELEHFNNNDNE